MLPRRQRRPCTAWCNLHPIASAKHLAGPPQPSARPPTASPPLRVLLGWMGGSCLLSSRLTANGADEHVYPRCSRHVGDRSDAAPPRRHDKPAHRYGIRPVLLRRIAPEKLCKCWPIVMVPNGHSRLSVHAELRIEGAQRLPCVFDVPAGLQCAGEIGQQLSLLKLDHCRLSPFSL